MTLESIATVATPSTVPVGTKIAVDTIPGTLEQVQLVKLVDAALNSEVGVLAPAGALYVDVRALPSGGITINDGGGAGSITVDGVFWPATQPVSGSVSVSNFPATQPISGSVSISGTPSVSVSNWPGTQPISGSVSITPTVGYADNVVAGTLGNTPVVQALGLGYNGTTYDRIRVGPPGTAYGGSAFGVLYVQGVGASGTLPVSLATVPPHPVTNAGTFAVQITGAPGQVDTELSLVNFADPVTAANMGVSAPPVQSVLVGFDGTNYGRARVGPAGTLISGTPPVLYVQGIGAAGAIPITGSVTAGGMQDNGAFVDNTSLVSPAGYILDETAGTTLTENDVAAARIDNKRAQVLVLEDPTTRGQRAGVTTRNALQIEGVAGGVAVPVSGSLSIGGVVDNNAFVDGTTNVTPVGFIFDEVAGTALTENDAGAARMDSKRAQVLVLEDETTRGRRATVTATKELVVGGSAVAGTPSTAVMTVQGITSMFPLDVAEKGTWVQLDDAAFGVGSSRVAMSGFLADEVSTDSVDEGDAGAARMTLDRRQIVVPTAHNQGGSTPFYNLDVDETEDAIKATAGQLYELYLNNTTNAQLYVKLYDGTVASVVVGTTPPVMTIPVPGNNDLDGAGVVRQWATGLAFATAITIAATTGAADNDTGTPATGALIASGAYK